VTEILEFAVKAIDVDARTELIQALIPLGLWDVKEVLEQEVRALTGERCKRQGMQGSTRRKLQEAFEEPIYEKAKEELLKIRKEPQEINRSAVNSLDEGFEETLTLHRLGLFQELGISFKTTNCMDSLMPSLLRRPTRLTTGATAIRCIGGWPQLCWILSQASRK
jgi:hypothetical protein